MLDRMYIDPDDIENETPKRQLACEINTQLERLREEKEAWRLLAYEEHALRTSTPLIPPKRCPDCGHYKHACQCYPSQNIL